VLIGGLLFLLLVTMLATAMFRSVGLQERIAGNTRDKQRAFEAAQSALQYGEWWLGQRGGGTGGTCAAGANNGNTLANMRVCDTLLSTPAMLPWATSSTYVPPTMTVAASLAAAGGQTASGDINYSDKPGLHISYMGMSPDGQGQLYQVTAYGYGGLFDSAANAATTAVVVRSTYQLKSGVKCLTCEP
jgi:type IV pilus assembly protein PilX